MDFSIPLSLPLEAQNHLRELARDFHDGNLTVKGYETKRNALLMRHEAGSRIFGPFSPRRTPTAQHSQSYSTLHARVRSWDENSSARSSIYNITTKPPSSTPSTPRHSHKRAASTVRTPSLSGSTNNGQSTAVPPNDIYNPMVPLLPRNSNTRSNAATPDPLSVILRGRFEHFPGQTALISINSKQKEIFITWDKLYLRAERVAHELNKSGLKKSDNVLLWFNKEDNIEFTIALLGCFISGMVAIPVSFESYSMSEIIQIVKMTSAKFTLISANCYKQLENLHSSNHNKVKIMKNGIFADMKFMKTDDLSPYTKAKKHNPSYEIPTVSYIEFTRTPLGRLSGVLMKHKAIQKQLQLLTEILNSRVQYHWKNKKNVQIPYSGKIKNMLQIASQRFITLSSLDSTRSTGLILGVLFNLYSGNLLITIDESIPQKAGGYEHIINKYRPDILLNDQLQLKQVVINYLEKPESISPKKIKVDFSCIKCCLTTCNTIDTDVTEMVVHKWLKNLGCIEAISCYSPVLSLIDFGGIFISLKDDLGSLENFPVHDSNLLERDELYISRDKLKEDKIEVSVTEGSNTTSFHKDYLKVEAFGYPIPDSTLCIVNPEEHTLSEDLTVGEIWLSSEYLPDEFYKMEKVNDFVFKAQLNFTKMYSYMNDSAIDDNEQLAIDKLEIIANICPPSTYFLRTKLMGFTFNGKIFVLSTVEDFFHQNKLIRLPNWTHTSNLSRVSSSKVSLISAQGSTTNSETNGNLSGMKRIIQTHYLQQITEVLVRTVSTVYEVAAFELDHNKNEHFLCLVVESSLARRSNPPSGEESLLLPSASQRKSTEKKMNELTEQIYRILWIFIKIQPLCILLVPKDSLPRRYCSLEVANSTVEKRFLSSELDVKFVKFQFDNVILDFLPHSAYYNESIFSQHLSNLRRAALESSGSLDKVFGLQNTAFQSSGIDYKNGSRDSRTGKNLDQFKTILEILEYRVLKTPNDLAFIDGGSTTKPNNNSVHNKDNQISWKAFDGILASFLKKIIDSKTPLSSGDAVIIMGENTFEYTAMIYACLFCNLVVIPFPVVKEDAVDDHFSLISRTVVNFKVKRIFIDGKVSSQFENHQVVAKSLKKYKAVIPKTTIYTKIKRKSGISSSMFKTILENKYKLKAGKNRKTWRCLVWIDEELDAMTKICVSMTHFTLLNACKVLKETWQPSSNTTFLSLYSHFKGLGFMLSNMLGVYTGSSTYLFKRSEVLADPTEFLLGIQNFNITNILLDVETFEQLMNATSKTILGKYKNEVTSGRKGSRKLSSLRSDVFRNIKNFMIPFHGRPDVSAIIRTLSNNRNIHLVSTQISYIYQHHFNMMISTRITLGIPPVELFIDTISLREGLIREANPDTQDRWLSLQDSGVATVCDEITIVNPETLMPCLDGEYGEIWVCSELTAFDYYISKNNLSKDPFITQQLTSKLHKEHDKGLTYLRTGDFGFIKSISALDSKGELNQYSMLFVLGQINETIDILGLMHFVNDLESTVYSVNTSIKNCIISKAGGLLVCLIQCEEQHSSNYGNLATLVTSSLLDKHGVILDLCAFIRPIPKNSGESNTLSFGHWPKIRRKIMDKWLNQKVDIIAQFGINYGENLSLYLISEYEKAGVPSL